MKKDENWRERKKTRHFYINESTASQYKCIGTHYLLCAKLFISNLYFAQPPRASISLYFLLVFPPYKHHHHHHDHLILQTLIFHLLSLTFVSHAILTLSTQKRGWVFEKWVGGGKLKCHERGVWGVSGVFEEEKEGFKNLKLILRE